MKDKKEILDYINEIKGKLAEHYEDLIDLFDEVAVNLPAERITALAKKDKPIEDSDFSAEKDPLAFSNYLSKNILTKLQDIIASTIGIAKEYHSTFFGVNEDELIDGYFLSQDSYDVYKRKYALMDRDGNLIDKSVYGTFSRVAAAVAIASIVNLLIKEEVVPVEGLLRRELEPAVELFGEFYAVMALGLATGAGRIMANAGASQFKPSTTLINCTVMKQIPDSMDGIMDVLRDAAITLKSGAGVGYAFSTIRPKGAFVQGAGAETSGVVSFMRVYDQMCQTIESAGGRRGAQMATLHISHPEIEDYIVAKQKDGELRAFNLSVFVPDEFMIAVNNGGTWDLWFWEKTGEIHENLFNLPNDIALIPPEKTPYDFPDYDKFIFGPDHIETQYGNAQLGQVFKKRVYKTVQAKDLYDKIMKATFEYSEPGVLFYDTINNKNPINEVENLIATNPCFVGSTRIATKDGLVKIEDLAKDQKPFDIVVDTRAPKDGVGKPYGDIGTTIKTALKAFPTGKKPIRRLVTKEGYELVLTPDHKLLTLEGYKEVQDLQSGDKILIQSGEGVFGDKLDLPIEPKTNKFGEPLPTKLFCQLAEHIGLYVGGRNEKHGLHLDYLKEILEVDVVPEFIFTAPKGIVTSFIHGYYAARRNEYQDSIIFSSESKQALQDIQLLLLNLGIYSRLSKTEAGAYTLTVTPETADKFEEEIGFWSPDDEFEEDFEQTKAEFSDFYATVEEIIDEGYANVYDLTEPDTHSLIANGFVAHNCGEVPLNPSGSCLLGSLYLHRFVKKPFKDVKPIDNFDWDAFIYVVDLWNEFLDIVNVITNLPLPSLRREAYVKRRHGLGFTGLADMLAALGLPYGHHGYTLEFVRLLTAVMEYQSFILSNMRLAEKYGPARMVTDYTWLSGSAGKAMLHSDFGFKLCVEGFELIEKKLPGLLKKINREKFVPRYSHSLSIAPTGTISFTFGNNVANGIEPVYALAAIRNIIVPGKKTKEQMKISYFLNTWYKNLTGIDLSEMDPKDWPEWVKTASYNVTVEDHVFIQEMVQAFTSQSISKTVNLPANYSFEEFKDLYMLAWQVGLKGITSYKFNPAFSIGVLTSPELLTKLKIRFTVEKDGKTEVIEVRGSDTVIYDGEEHNAANLFEALKEGMYGRY